MPQRRELIILDDLVEDEPMTEERIQKIMEWWNSLEERLGVRFRVHQLPWREGDFYRDHAP